MGLIWKGTWLDHFIHRFLNAQGKRCMILVQIYLFLSTISHTITALMFVPNQLRSISAVVISNVVRLILDSVGTEKNAFE